VALQLTSQTFRISEKNRKFSKRIKELSGEEIDLCFQCGGCSSACPMTSHMDLLPSKVMRFVQLGMEEVLRSRTIWVCSTCLNCTVRCPRGIDIANVMEALRQTLLRAKFNHLELDGVKREELREIPPVAIISSLRKFSA
jgi:heterodisulfide reductase subunit C